LTFATHGENPAACGSTEIRLIYLQEQAAAGVTLLRDYGAVPEAEPPPQGPGLPEVIACGPILASWRPRALFGASARTSRAR
jgi:hypothetical protein